MDAREQFGGFEGGGAFGQGDAARCEGGMRGGGNRLLRERMRELQKISVGFEREVRAFVAFDEDEDWRHVDQVRFAREHMFIGRARKFSRRVRSGGNLCRARGAREILCAAFPLLMGWAS